MYVCENVLLVLLVLLDNYLLWLLLLCASRTALQIIGYFPPLGDKLRE